MKQFVVIAYDIEDDRARKKISDTLMDCGGLRVQKSVFECLLSKTQLCQLRQSLKKIKEAGDSIRYYLLCERCIAKLIADESAELRQKFPQAVEVV